jgi:hypothetical protein
MSPAALRAGFGCDVRPMIGATRRVYGGDARCRLVAETRSGLSWPGSGSVRRCRPRRVPDVSEVSMGSLVKKRRKKMSKHKYRKRIKANRHKRRK